MKILAYEPSWRLPEKTLIQLYKSLVRSIIEYSSFFINTISSSYRKTLEAVQNNALRIIFRTTWEATSTSESQKAQVQTIEERLKNLNEKYFVEALLSSNPLIETLFEDYLSFKERTTNNYSTTKTILCHLSHFEALSNRFLN